MKPKIGEVWEVGSFYSWGQCLVAVEEVFGWGFRVIVIAGEKGNIYTVLEGESINQDITNWWSLTSSMFIRRIYKRWWL